jgi:hypothetical protein
MPDRPTDAAESVMPVLVVPPTGNNKAAKLRLNTAAESSPVLVIPAPDNAAENDGAQQ